MTENEFIRVEPRLTGLGGTQPRSYAAVLGGNSNVTSPVKYNVKIRLERLAIVIGPKPPSVIRQARKGRRARPSGTTENSPDSQEE